MKCETCPVSGDVCRGEERPRLCELARTRPAYAHQLKVIAGEAEPIPEPQWPYLKEPWKSRIERCESRAKCPTGCQKATCLAGKGDEWGQVTLEDCWNCLNSNA